MKISITNSGCVVLIGIMTIIAFMVILINAPAEGAANPPPCGNPPCYVFMYPTPTANPGGYPSPLSTPEPESYPEAFTVPEEPSKKKEYIAESGGLAESLWGFILDLFTH